MEQFWLANLLASWGWKSFKEVPVSFAPYALSSKAEWTRSGILIMFCFVFTVHANSPGYFCVSGVLGARWNAGSAPCLQQAVTGGTWLPGSTQTGTVKKRSDEPLLKRSSPTTASLAWACTGDCPATLVWGWDSRTPPRSGMALVTDCPSSCLSSAQGSRKWCWLVAQTGVFSRCYPGHWVSHKMMPS